MKEEIIYDYSCIDYDEDFHSIKNIFSNISYKLILLQVENSSLFVQLYSFFLSKRCSIILISKETRDSNLFKICNDFKPDLTFLLIENEIQFDDYIFLQKKTYSVFKRKVIIIDDFFSPSILLSTSGSTGSQKFVRVSYENLIANTKSIVKYLSLKSSDVTITNLPLHYSFGLSVLNTHLHCGAKVVLTNYSVVQKEFWDLVKENKVTTFFGVPYTFEMLFRIRFFRMDLPHIRLIGQAGGKMNLELQEKYIEYCDQKNIEYYTMYGQTEATARMSYLPAKMSKSKKGSIGIAIPYGKFELCNDNKQIINEIDSEGELVYYGPNVSLGYAQIREDLYKGDENNGVLYTGDIAKRDNDSYYYIVGRKNRFLKLFGNRISLQELEDRLQDLGVEVVCCGIDDRLVAYVTNNEKIDFVLKWLTETTSIHISAFEVRYIDKIPRNIAGKILYNELDK